MAEKKGSIHKRLLVFNIEDYILSYTIGHLCNPLMRVKMMHLLLIETAGNQRFIFDTNKLRDNIGASELVYRAGVTWVTDALKMEPAAKPVFQASGKALLLVPDRETGRRIICAVTLRALEQAPGLSVRGAISEEPVSLACAKKVHEAVKALFHRHEALGALLPGPETRFATLPVVQPCARSGLPAESLFQIAEGEGAEPLSAVSFAKQAYRNKGWRRMTEMVNQDRFGPSSPFAFANDVNDLEKRIDDLNFVAVVHADGNGLGQIFLNFDRYLDPGADGKTYLDRLGAFSQALDDCTIRAFRGALSDMMAREWWRTDQPPVVPLVLGGDDLTLLCDGRYALRLTARFLERFNEETARCETVSWIAGAAGLGACAGVALVKPHFPFHAAYELAEALLQSAKGGKRHFRQADGDALPFTALDFHVLYDSADADLGRIRRQLQTRTEGASLTARPYIIGAPATGLPPAATAWMAARPWSWLDQVQGRALPGGTGVASHLPNSILHALRDAAHDGVAMADARLRATLGREMKEAPERMSAWTALVGDTGLATASLFVDTPDGPVTRLLDALDIVGLWR